MPGTQLWGSRFFAESLVGLVTIYMYRCAYLEKCINGAFETDRSFVTVCGGEGFFSLYIMT